MVNKKQKRRCGCFCVFSIIYLLCGILTFSIGGNSATRIVNRVGLQDQSLVSINEAFLDADTLYVKATKRVKLMYEDSSPFEETFFIKYILSKKSDSASSWLKIFTSNRSNYENRSNVSIRVTIVTENMLKEFSKKVCVENDECQTNVTYTMNKNLDAAIFQSKRNELLVNNKLLSEVKPYYKNLKYTTFPLSDRLPYNRAKYYYPEYVFKSIGSIIFDILTWPFQLVTGVFSPGW